MRAALITLLLMTGEALAQDTGSFIVIYRLQAPYWNLVRQPAQARETIQPYLQPGRVDLADWGAFKSDAQRYLAPLVVKNEYPGANLPKLVVALLQAYPGIPIAVTWTGGIAVSNAERMHAAEIYKLFRENPDQYERTKVSADPARDPIHPEHRAGPTLVAAAKPQGPWWKTCEGEAEPPTPDQARRLEAFGLDRFSPKPPGADRSDARFSRADLVRRFGEPLGTSSKKIRRDPQDPYDKSLLIMTTWQFPGFTIVTDADESAPDVLWIDSGEVVAPHVRLGHGVAVGQPIEQWERQFGRPRCSPEQVPYIRERFEHEWQASYFACTEDKTVRCPAAYLMHLYTDSAGTVVRMKWSSGSMH